MLKQNIISLIKRNTTLDRGQVEDKVLDNTRHNQSEQSDRIEKDNKSVHSEIPEIFLTENGRSAIYLFLKSLQLKPGSKVAVQPFTCNSSVIPILWAGYKPVYIDIEEKTLSMNPKLLELEAKNGTLNGVILQHSFGIPANIEEIRSICDRYGLFLLEDCAHTLDIGSRVDHQGKRIGLSGDASIISFGLEKLLPTKVGGALLLNNKAYKSYIEKEYNSWSVVSHRKSFLWLINPFLRYIGRRFGKSGSVILLKLSEIGIFQVGFQKSELVGEMPSDHPRKLSADLAWVINQYFPLIDEIILSRKKQGMEYSKKLDTEINEGEISKMCQQHTIPYLKYPIILKESVDRDDLVAELEKRGFYITDWYCKVLYPPSTDLSKYLYEVGTCPISEKVGRLIINLPMGSLFDLSVIDVLKELNGEISVG